MTEARSPRRPFVLAALAAATLCACAAPPQPVVLPALPPPQEVAAPLPPAPPPDDLYARAAQAEEQYHSASLLIDAGDEVTGEEEIIAAMRALHSVADDCTRTPGCDIEQILAVFDRLLGEQEIRLKTQAARIGTLEADIDEEIDPEREPGTSPFVAAIPELGRVETLLRGTELREIISLNGPVKAAIHDWLTWMRPMLMEAHENYQYLRDEIAPIYEKAGLPEALLFAMIATESGGKVHVHSKAGAAGLLQFMRRTGQVYGLREVDGFDQRLDPVAATRANVAYLNERFEELNDNLEKALAAYNGGESRMQGLQRKLGGASLWDNRMYYALPRETREYVPRILAAAWLFLHPEEYAVEFPALDTTKTELVLREPLSIGELAVCLGQWQSRNGWFRTLRNLNPRLDPSDRLEAGETVRIPTVLAAAYEKNCLEGELLERARALHDANLPSEPAMIPYVVERNDTLGRIASRHRCVSLGELAAINNIRPPHYVIHVGQMLKIPTCN